jgi:hypothetical protein
MKFIPQSFLDERLFVFVDFASSAGNQTTKLWFESTGVRDRVPSLEKNRLPGQAATYFLEFD